MPKKIRRLEEITLKRGETCGGKTWKLPPINSEISFLVSQNVGKSLNSAVPGSAELPPTQQVTEQVLFSCQLVFKDCINFAF